MSTQNGTRPKAKKPRKSESVKDRPKTIEELASAIDAGRLDNRTAPAKRIIASRAAIQAAPTQASQVLCYDALAQNTAILSAITERIGKPDAKLIDDDGKLTPLVQSLFEVQGQIMTVTKTMLRLEMQKQGKPVGKPEGIAALILEGEEE